MVSLGVAVPLIVVGVLVIIIGAGLSTRKLSASPLQTKRFS